MGRFCILAIVNNAVIKYRYAFITSKSLVSFPLGIYPEVQLLYLFLTFFEESIIFHCNNNLYITIVGGSIYIPISGAQLLPFFIPSPTFISCLLDNSYSNKWKVTSHCGLMCIFLMINVVERLFTCLTKIFLTVQWTK